MAKTIKNPTKAIKNPKNKKICENKYYFCGSYYNRNDFLKAVREEALHIYKCSNEKPKKISKKYFKKHGGGLLDNLANKASDAFNYVKNFDGNITPALTIRTAKEALLLCAELEYVKNNKDTKTNHTNDESSIDLDTTHKDENHEEPLRDEEKKRMIKELIAEILGSKAKIFRQSDGTYHFWDSTNKIIKISGIALSILALTALKGAVSAGTTAATAATSGLGIAGIGAFIGVLSWIHSTFAKYAELQRTITLLQSNCMHMQQITNELKEQFTEKYKNQNSLVTEKINKYLSNSVSDDEIREKLETALKALYTEIYCFQYKRQICKNNY